MIYVENKQKVLPGTLLTDNNFEHKTGTFLEDGKIYSSITGITYFESNKICVIPFKDFYKPHYGDLIIGKIVSINFSSWTIKINNIFNGFLPTSELYDKNGQKINNVLNLNDMLLLRVANVDEINRVRLTLRYQGLGKFNQGDMINISQPTVHFLSEENAFLTNLIENSTQTDIIIGKNGLLWVNGSFKGKRNVLKIIETIDKEPYKRNLVKDIQNMVKDL